MKFSKGKNKTKRKQNVINSFAQDQMKFSKGKTKQKQNKTKCDQFFCTRSDFSYIGICWESSHTLHTSLPYVHDHKTWKLLPWGFFTLTETGKQTKNMNDSFPKDYVFLIFARYTKAPMLTFMIYYGIYNLFKIECIHL